MEADQRLRQRVGKFQLTEMGHFRPLTYTINQLERLMKEVKRRTKVVEVSGDSVAVEKLSYLGLTSVNERLSARRLKGFAEIEMENYHVVQTH